MNADTPTGNAALVLAVQNMRHAQKEYFRTKNPSALEASKRLERTVDAMLADLAKTERQRDLFPA